MLSVYRSTRGARVEDDPRDGHPATAWSCTGC